MEQQLNHVEVTESSGNVFADIGLPDPERLLAQAKIAAAIQKIVDAEIITLDQLAAGLKADRKDVQEFLDGDLIRFSPGELLECLIRRGLDVNIAIVERTAA